MQINDNTMSIIANTYANLPTLMHIMQITHENQWQHPCKFLTTPMQITDNTHANYWQHPCKLLTTPMQITDNTNVIN